MQVDDSQRVLVACGRDKKAAAAAAAAAAAVNRESVNL
jgi:hypothetical protein